MPTNLEQLQKLGQLFNADKLVSNQDIETVLKAFIQIFANNKKGLDEMSADMKAKSLDLFEKIAEAQYQLQQKVDSQVASTKEQLKSELDKTAKDLLEQVKGAVADVLSHKPEDGKPADPEEVAQLVMEKINNLPADELFTLEDKAGQIIEIINELPIDQEIFKIDASHIRGLQINKNGTATVRTRDVFYFDETTLVGTNIQFIKFQGSGVQASIATDGSLIVTVNGGTGSATFVDELMTDSGNHTLFTLSATPSSGTLLVINENTGQAVPTSAYTNTAANVTFTSNQQIDDGAGNLVTPTFRARYSH